MADLIDIKIDSSAVEAVLRNLETAGRDMAPAFRAVAMSLLSLTEKRFADEGPGWPEWSPAYAATREGGKMLQDTGQLAAAVDTDYGSHFALIGDSKIYAAIHQLGGTVHHEARSGTVYFKQKKNGEVGTKFVKKRKSNFAQDVSIGAHDTEMPARPYLPIDVDGNLDPDAEQAVLEDLIDHFERAAHP
jgi:phage virion morphogenesis protein